MAALATVSSATTCIMADPPVPSTSSVALDNKLTVPSDDL